MLTKYRNQRFRVFVREMESLGHTVQHTAHVAHKYVGPGVMFKMKPSPSDIACSVDVHLLRVDGGMWFLHPWPSAFVASSGHDIRRWVLRTAALIGLVGTCYLFKRFPWVGPHGVVGLVAHGLCVPVMPHGVTGISISTSKSYEDQ